MNNSAIGS